MTSRTAALALLALALILGVGLRFYRLGTADLSADEAASWAGAAAPDLRTVIAVERKLDPGKLALYDAALHGWIGLWGDGAGAMRALSAALGTIAIALVFAATLEFGSGLCGPAEIRKAEFGAAAFAALLAAVNPILVGEARTVRMYPLLLVLELLQVICLLRAVSERTPRPGRIASLAGVTAFSALAIACNFTGALLVAAEAMWLAWMALRRRTGRGSGAAAELHLLYPALALCAGVALLGPSAPMAGRRSIAVVHAGILGWSHLRPPWWPLEMLRDATGKAPFLPLLPLAIYGGWRQQRDGRVSALGFLLWWMLAPVALVMAISYAITPFEETRYVISSVAAFVILAAIGLAAIDSARLRIGLLVLLVALSLDHLRRDFVKPQFVQWREAVALALAAAPPGGAYAVIPGYAANAVRYYLPPKLRASVESAEDRCDPGPHVLLLGRDDLLAPAQLAVLRDCDPVVVGRFKLVEVRKR
ncbi:MAG TPA: hypothetical protein VGI29_08175 [Candidatus Binataceae bacterium]